jgi:heterodisulfide reductase subunit C
MRQIIFAIFLVITLAVFAFTVSRILKLFRLTKPAFPIRNIGKRIWITLEIAIGQSKIFRKPVIGLFHALVFWGFCVILFGSLEMVIDGLTGSEKALKGLGTFYDIMTASGDIFSFIIFFMIVVFLTRRNLMNIKRFEGIEMKKMMHMDANLALTLILLLMISLTWMNAYYCKMQTVSGQEIAGTYPVGNIIMIFISNIPYHPLKLIYGLFWWTHILLIFLFANILPYSKHFHVFLSIPNVFLSRLEPLGKLDAMAQVTREVKLMLDPNSDPSAFSDSEKQIIRFGVKDCEDVTWKSYFDSLSCTQCGRCTSVCPANITGKKLSPRKILMDVRARMKEKGPMLISQGLTYDDKKSLVRDYISEEELWACTTCQACAKECPININHPSLILAMRRYLVMEEGAAPGGLKTSFNNIENNGAPWQFSSEDRLHWAKDLKYQSV